MVVNTPTFPLDDRGSQGTVCVGGVPDRVPLGLNILFYKSNGRLKDKFS